MERRKGSCMEEKNSFFKVQSKISTDDCKPISSYVQSNKVFRGKMVLPGNLTISK